MKVLLLLLAVGFGKVLLLVLEYIFQKVLVLVLEYQNKILYTSLGTLRIQFLDKLDNE